MSGKFWVVIKQSGCASRDHASVRLQGTHRVGVVVHLVGAAELKERRETPLAAKVEDVGVVEEGVDVRLVDVAKLEECREVLLAARLTTLVPLKRALMWKNLCSWARDL